MTLPAKYTDPAEASRIYFLPNLMTAGNLFCGFLAAIWCIRARFALELPQPSAVSSRELFEEAVWFILAAVIFDILDGRLARLGGRESLFGKEFDSIADTVSFGMAPALLVFFLILSPTGDQPWFQQVGWLVGFVYLLCAAVRLARFNVLTHPLVQKNAANSTGDFVGLPVPAAAGTIASLVLVLNRTDLGNLAIFFPPLLILIAFLMVSSVRYPSFKYIDWNTRMRFTSFIYLLFGLVLVFAFRSYAICVIFLVYIFYGLGRHVAEVVRHGRLPTSEEEEQMVEVSEFKGGVSDREEAG